MCGIVAIYAYGASAPPVDRQELFRVRDHMAARGPDGEGAYFEGRHLALGHRRLAIIDLSEAGAQPMASSDGAHVVTYNGEIYNYRELRSSLEGRGRKFHSLSDTEVLLHLYAEYGEDMVPKLRGMFAFAIWDGRRQTLFLARDPYGIKPLYFADDGHTVRVASQVKALLAGGGVDKEADLAGVAGFLVFGSVPEPLTCHRSIRALPAGCFARVDRNGVGVPYRYFSVARIFSNAKRAGAAAAGAPLDVWEQVRSALLDSVRHHLVSDVPVGAFLSAGVDSAALVGLMHNAGQRKIRTATLAFAEFVGTPADESRGAQSTAALWGTDHKTSLIDAAEFGAALPHVLEVMDQPSLDGFNSWLVCRAARAVGLKVVISGVGGDELFGGYPSFAVVPRWSTMLRPASMVPGLGALSVGLWQRLPLSLRHTWSPKLGGLLRYGGTCAGAYLLKRGLFLPEELPQVIGEEEAREGLAGLRPSEVIASELYPDPGTPFARVATLEASLYLRNQLLRDSDWASMSHSLELRTPLVDAELLRTLAPLLVHHATTRSKRVLAAAPAPALPATTVNRPKSGFALPMQDWIERVGDDSWRAVPVLAHPRCHWSRRLAYMLVRRLGVPGAVSK